MNFDKRIANAAKKMMQLEEWRRSERTPSPPYRNRFKCWFRFFISLENEICALNAACVFLITQELYYYQRIFQRSDIGSYEARLREKLNLLTSRVCENFNFTRARFTEFSSMEVVRRQLNSRENKFSSSSLTICIENAIELEANSISPIFHLGSNKYL